AHVPDRARGGRRTRGPDRTPGAEGAGGGTGARDAGGHGPDPPTRPARPRHGPCRLPPHRLRHRAIALNVTHRRRTMHTPRFRTVVVAAVAASAALLPAPSALATSRRGAPAAAQADAKGFNAKNFSARSIVVDNRFLPLVPGKQVTLTGTTTAG